MFRKLLPYLLCPADVARLGAFVTATQQNHDLLALQPVINTEARPPRDAQLKHPTAHGFAIAEIPGAHPCQANIHRRLHFSVMEGLELLVKRD
jgi:hypothetical protein